MSSIYKIEDIYHHAFYRILLNCKLQQLDNFFRKHLMLQVSIRHKFLSHVLEFHSLLQNVVDAV